MVDGLRTWTPTPAFGSSTASGLGISTSGACAGLPVPAVVLGAAAMVGLIAPTGLAGIGAAGCGSGGLAAESQPRYSSQPTQKRASAALGVPQSSHTCSVITHP